MSGTTSGLSETNTHCHPCLHVTMQRGCGDMGSQMDMYTCTDACAHFNQGMGTEVGSLRHNHCPTQGHSSFHITIQRG